MTFRFFLAAAVGLFALLLAERARASCADPFANPDQVVDFHLRTTSAVWAQFQASQPEPAGNQCEEQYPYFPAEFRCGSEEGWISIGFRRKRDRTETTQKLPIKLDFNHAVMGQRWPTSRGGLGFRKLTLNSGMADDAGRSAGMGREGNPGVLSALLTEALAWRLMRRELRDASGVAYARLTLHFTDTGAERYQGLYILLEDIDRTAVEARYRANNGLLTKTTDPMCQDEVVFDDGPPNAATDAFTTWLGLRAADFPGGWYARTNQALALDELLRQEAFREVLANTTDTLLGNGNNRFALDLVAGKRRYLPWDLDDLFRPFPQVHDPMTPLVRACQSGPGCTQSPLATRVRHDPEIRPRYLEQLCVMTNGVLESGRVLAELAAVDAMIRPIIAAEVPLLWAPEGLDPLDATTEGTYAAEFERMRTWIPARIQAVRSFVAAEGVACAAGCTDGRSLACDDLGTPSERTCQSGVWSSCAPVAPTGTGGSGGGSGSGGAADAGAEDGGCGCRVAGGGRRAGWVGLLVALGLVARRRRARG